MSEPTDLRDELETLKGDVRPLRRCKSRLGPCRRKFSGMVHHPLESALPFLLVPLITIIVKSLKKSKPGAPAAPTAAENN